jgi:phosphoglycolate phosphatase
MKLKNIKLFIFDWSGVISDDRMPVYLANMKILEDYGKPTMTFEEWLPKTTMTPIEFLNNHGIFDKSEVLFDLYKKYFDEMMDLGNVPKAYDDSKDALKKIKKENKTLWILSSHPVKNLMQEAKKYKMKDFFDGILGESKDKVCGLKEVCSKANIPEKLTAYIGDTIYDIQAAKKTSITSVAISRGYHLRERLEKEKPDGIFDSLLEFTDYLLTK